jgi:acetylornithine deacetylase
MSETSINNITSDSASLLKELIAIPSFSREEAAAADHLGHYLDLVGITFNRKGNNIWAFNHYFNPGKPVILLNSHIDTVKPASSWTKDPFFPGIEDDKLYGLGSNDAGGCLVSLLAVFRHYYAQRELAYNLVFAATSEEEISGANGIESILPGIGNIDFAIIGEPTGMQMAVAEKGLLVLDCVAYGKTGHAARDEGENAIYKALKDIEWFKNYRFEKESAMLGPLKMNVTRINAGEQHNIIPGECHFTVDIRLTEDYTHEEVLDLIRKHISSEVKPRSNRIKPSSISITHPIVKAGLSVGLKTYGSPTTSDKALIPFPSLKIGPGDSARSHSADEYIYLVEIKDGIRTYIEMLDRLLFPGNQNNQINNEALAKEFSN